MKPDARSDKIIDVDSPGPEQEAALPAQAEAPEGVPTGFGPSGRAGAPPVQRVRFTYEKGPEARYIGHLDVMRTWERAFRRSGLPLAYTFGYTPHPRLTSAAPLALGATGEAELMDAYLTAPIPLDELRRRIGAALPPACTVVALDELPVEGSALMALTRWAEYRVECVSLTDESDGAESHETAGSRWSRRELGAGGMFSEEEIPALVAAGEPWRPPAQRLPPLPPAAALPPQEALVQRIRSLLAAERLPRNRVRDGKVAVYDLRPLLLGVWVHAEAPPDRVCLGVRVRNDSQGAGRPEEVAAALGLRARLVHRVRIGLEGDQP